MDPLAGVLLMEQAMLRAITKARLLGVPGLVSQCGVNTWCVPGGTRALTDHGVPDTSYTIQFAAGMWHCDCPAGVAGHTCYHVAAVLLHTKKVKA